MIIVSPILDAYFKLRLKRYDYRKKVYLASLQQKLRSKKLGVILLRNLNEVMATHTSYHQEFSDLLNDENYQQKFWESDLGYMWYQGNFGAKNPSFQLTLDTIITNSYESHLDLGCGWGELSFQVASNTNAKRVVGIDISEDIILKAKAFHGNTHAVFLHKDVFAIDEKFDLITIFGPSDYISPSDFNDVLEKLITTANKEILLHNSLRKQGFENVLNIKEAIEIKRYDVGYVQPINFLLKELQLKYNFKFELKKHGLDALLAQITIL